MYHGGILAGKEVIRKGIVSSDKPNVSKGIKTQ